MMKSPGATHMKSITSKIIILGLSLQVSGCFLSEDKGTVEVGNPVSGEADFTVVTPPPSGDSSEATLDPDDTNPPVVGDGNSDEAEFTFLINNGARSTNQNTLQLQFSTIFSFFNEIKISSNADCQGGSYESLVPSKNVSDFTQNSRVIYSVRFREPDGQQSLCYSASIFHDNLGPDIQFMKYPRASLELGATSEIQFSVSDLSGVKEVKCRLNTIERTCFSGVNTIQLSQMPEGAYTFTVEAKDNYDQASTQSVQWNIVSLAKFLSQNILIKEDKKVDVLIVIDNSGSMEFEQKNMADRVRNMLSILRGFDYRIGVTTTDPNPTKTTKGLTYYGDGDLIPIYGQNGAKWVESSLDETIAQIALGLTLQRPETGSGSEQGIRAVYRFVEKSSSHQFFREGANFATLVISDEDESANTTKNDPTQLLQLISTNFLNQKAYSFHSIITKPGDTSCKNTHGATYGARYKTISDLTGGVIGSVCESDYATQVNGISTAIRDLVKQMTLSCEPLPQYPITLSKDGVNFNASYVVEGVNLKFADALPAGDYKIDYACLK